MMQATEALSPADLRALVARRRVRLYEVAAILGLHPSRIGKYLNERQPLDHSLALKIRDAVERVSRSPE